MTPLRVLSHSFQKIDHIEHRSSPLIGMIESWRPDEGRINPHCKSYPRTPYTWPTAGSKPWPTQPTKNTPSPDGAHGEPVFSSQPSVAPGSHRFRSDLPQHKTRCPGLSTHSARRSHPQADDASAIEPFTWIQRRLSSAESRTVPCDRPARSTTIASAMPALPFGSGRTTTAQSGQAGRQTETEITALLRSPRQQRSGTFFHDRRSR
jgi:hypothetical protein